MAMSTTIKTLVSKKKLRYVSDGYNLDLSYINDRIIAMGFPAENFEALYRNSLDEVRKFLQEKHPDHYRIYNLCSERFYDKKKFDGRVENYPFDDHNPPKFSLILEFCEAVRKWLDENPKNVAVVHCKAGKGRTGVMICCYLLHCGAHQDAKNVLDYYGRRRTADEKGVTIPSQRRYIHYYDYFLQHQLSFKSVKLYLKCIVLDPVPSFQNIANDCFLSFTVDQHSRGQYESRTYVIRKTERQVRLEVEPPLLLADDVKFEFMTKMTKLLKKANKEFHFWLNTFFIDAQMNGGLAHDILTRDNSVVNDCDDDLSSSDVGGGDNLFFSQSLNLPSRAAPTTTAAPGNGHDQNGEFVGSTNGDSHQPADHQIRDFGPAAAAAANYQTVTGPIHFGNAPSLAELMKRSASIVEETSPAMAVTLPVCQPHNNGCQQVAEKTPLSQTSSNSNASSASSSSTSLVAANNNNHSVTLPSPAASSNHTTTKSFIAKRSRHASVPQTKSSPGGFHAASTAAKIGHNSAPTASAAASNPRPIPIEGVNIPLRLHKHQIDKANKDKQCKIYSENFSVTLFLIKPTDQSDNLVDYTLEQTFSSNPSSEGFRQFTVTPVSASSAASVKQAGNAAEGQTNGCQPEKKKFGGKGFSKKSEKNLKQLNKKSSSTEEEELQQQRQLQHQLSSTSADDGNVEHVIKADSFSRQDSVENNCSSGNGGEYVSPLAADAAGIKCNLATMPDAADPAAECKIGETVVNETVSGAKSTWI